MRITSPYFFGLHTPLPEVGRRWPPQVYIQQETARLEMEREPLRILIDQRETRREIGLYTPWMRMDEQVSLAQENALRYIGQMAQEGDRLMRIESGEDAIPNLAAEKWPEPPPETNVTMIPQTRPDIAFRGGEVHIEVTPGEVVIRWEIAGPGKAGS